MLVPIEIACQHLRVEVGGPDASLIELMLGAAQKAAMDFINRQVYEDAATMAAAVLNGDAGTDPIVLNDAIKAAILLILGHLYANREDTVTTVTVVALPMGSRSLLQPYRVKMGV